MIYDFDLRTPNAAYAFLLDIFNMSGEEYIEELIINSHNDMDEFWKRNYETIKNININYIRIWAFHVVGSLDDCAEICRSGLKNLQKVLSEDTQLNQMLKAYGLSFDIEERLMFYKGNKYNVDYDWYRNHDYSNPPEKYLEPIAHRIYYDYCVDGFLMNNDVFSYGTSIHERPEFMIKLSDAFPELDAMENEWAEKSKSYKIHFYAMFSQVNRITFELKATEEELTENEIDRIKRWMIYKAIDRARDDLFSEVFIYIKDEVDIPPSQIVQCEEI